MAHGMHATHLKTFCVSIEASFYIILEIWSIDGLKRLYEQKLGEINEHTVGERKAKLQYLKNNLTSQQYIFYKQTAQSNGIVSASFQVSPITIIAKNMKPFTDSNYIKDCLIAADEEICPKKSDLFTQISLSRQTVERRKHFE
ncbi:hypothetical protein TNIN_348171 [Trichonephila inaurata madagascariensis]|uniref:Uncharacterized protein n=1 Tax=Trichonephila inaurata madagascariensis TaxID=2747483 RepID=A0A8X7C1E3_9ARAC|nr:hypothetical protein TNIN_348171 [Trichonephila inaurata madagascariensis]